MKIGLVAHEKCREYAAYTYVWVDDDVTQAQFQTIADTARDAYLKAEEEFEKEPAAKWPGTQPDYLKHPDQQVAEVKVAWDQEMAVWREWEERKKATKHAFAKYLIAASGGKMRGFYEVNPALRADVKWGHRHGLRIDYSEVDPSANDFNVPEDEGL